MSSVTYVFYSTFQVTIMWRTIEESLKKILRQLLLLRNHLKTVHLSTQDMASGLSWDPLKTRGAKHAISVEAKSNTNLETKAVKLSDKWKEEHSTSIYTADALFTESNYHEKIFF